MEEIELELTYLAKEIPKNIKQSQSKEIVDIYLPKSTFHPRLRIRKNGNKYEITKKTPVNPDNFSELIEHTIPLTEQEFKQLSTIDGKKLQKIRYNYEYEKNKFCEIDIFKDNLNGLILIDFEFKTKEEKSNFKPPEFCLKDVTQEDCIAGGFLAGKSYEDIAKKLEKHKYERIIFE